ncbi:arylsulfatase B-like [Glandiceps talaboti]
MSVPHSVMTMQIKVTVLVIYLTNGLWKYNSSNENILHAAEEVQKPNIMFVVADDMGWNDIGYHNSDIYTPMLDSLAREGVILNQSYVPLACTQSRAAYMAAYYPHRTGFQHKTIHPMQPIGLSLNFTLLPQQLKELGYATHMVGKWHLGYCKWSYTPTERGFDSFYGYYNGFEDHYNHSIGDYLDLHDNRLPDWSQNGTYSTYLYSDKAIDVITSHNQSKPLFMYLALQSVHGPLEVPDEYYNLYPFIEQKNRRVKSAMITAMDDVVRNVVTALEDFGLWNNTLLVFTSDNGGSIKPKHAGNNWPLRGTKNSLFEGGTRIPSFVHGNMLEKTGYVNDGMIHAVDWYPTFVELAGGKTDPDIDGINVWDMLSKGNPSPRTQFVYNIDEIDHVAAIRVGDYKLIVGDPGGPYGWIPVDHDELQENSELFADVMTWNRTYLFNVKDDPTEHHNLADSMPEKVKELEVKLEEQKDKLVPAIVAPLDKERSDPRHFGGVWTPGWC